MMTTGDLVVIIIRLLTSAQGLLLTHVCRLFISLLIFFLRWCYSTGTGSDKMRDVQVCTREISIG